MTSIQDGLARYLTACRHDIAHLNGTSEQDHAAWVEAHLAEAEVLYHDAARAKIADAGDEVDAAEHALVAVKRWAQGEYFRG